MDTPQEQIFMRRHDFYYQVLLVYLVFAAAYTLVTGTVTDETVQFGFRDPVVYIIGAFILHAVVMLAVNLVRSPRLVVGTDRLVFRTRHREKTVLFSDIQKVLLTRERRRFDDLGFAVAKLRIATRRRMIRIRVSHYERERELYQVFRDLRRARGAGRTGEDAR
jgi:hypothetical protein